MQILCCTLKPLQSTRHGFAKCSTVSFLAALSSLLPSSKLLLFGHEVEKLCKEQIQRSRDEGSWIRFPEDATPLVTSGFGVSAQT